MPSEMLEDNPFILVYNALWETARDNEILAQYIYPGNQIDYSENLDPKSLISDSDLPQLTLLSTGFTPAFHNTSSSSRCVKSYSWILSTGNFNINEIYNIISWELFSAMLEWQVSLTSLIWKNISFVKEVRSLTSIEGTALFNENKEIRGWAASWPIEVDMHFPTELIREKSIERV